jgi:UDPglucose--hexose-1-phosphate uridylyltransferase
VVAPARASRPAGGDGSCPFCEGNEAETPPETFALGRERGGPDTPGWQVRVVPNLYPALERQEVVVHTPRHVTTVVDLSADELGRVAEAWSMRAGAARDEGFPYLHAFVNEGRPAGASLPHSHSQLAWLREPPPAMVGETGDLVAHLAAELKDGSRIIAERDGLVLLAAWAGRLPYELLIAPAETPHGSAFGSPLLPAALGLLGDAIRRLRGAEGEVPWNAWLHDGPHWHLEIVPRLTVQAGLELGAGIHIQTLDPAEAAARLRNQGP